MTDPESQLRHLRFRPPPPALRDRVLAPARARETAPAPRTTPEKYRLVAPLAALGLVIARLHVTPPATPRPAGPPLSYAEFRQIMLLKELQVAMLQREGCLPDCDGPTFAAPRHL
jgi:hypothetical protein